VVKTKRFINRNTLPLKIRGLYMKKMPLKIGLTLIVTGCISIAAGCGGSANPIISEPPTIINQIIDPREDPSNVAPDIQLDLERDSMLIENKQIEIGDVVPIPNPEWIYSKNVIPIRIISDLGYVRDVGDANIYNPNTLTETSTCYTETGSEVNARIFTEDEKVLVQYTSPENRRNTGPFCPTGIYFLVEPEDFVSYNDGYEYRIDHATRLKRDIEKIMSGESQITQVENGDITFKIGDKATIKAQDEYHARRWKYVLNPEPITHDWPGHDFTRDYSYRDNGDFDKCLRRLGGKYTVLGFVDQYEWDEKDIRFNSLGFESITEEFAYDTEMLVEYARSDLDIEGGQCADGALLLVGTSEMYSHMNE